MRKALAYYDSCIDVNEIEQLKGKPLQKLISNYGSWSITDEDWVERDWHLIKNLARIHRNLALHVLFKTSVEIDNKNSSQYVITVRRIVKYVSLWFCFSQKERSSADTRSRIIDKTQELELRKMAAINTLVDMAV